MVPVSPERRVVVGVDGSQGADTALIWAAAEAKRRDALLEVVFVYGRAPLADGERDGEFDDEAQRAVDRATRTVTVLEPSLVVKAEAREGNPAKVLVEASAHADLLVVGSRGRGGF